MKSTEMINKIKTLLDIEVKFETRKLDNGTVVEAESFSQGNEIFIKTEDEKVAMPVGEYTLESGDVLLVKEEGMIAELGYGKKEEEEEEEMRDDGKEAAVDDWAGMEKRIKNLEDAVADLKKDKEPRSEETKDEKDIEVDAKEEVKEEVKEELSEPAVEPIKHSPEGTFEKKSKSFHFSNKRKLSVLDRVMEKLTN
jgi:hypothetical protein